MKKTAAILTLLLSAAFLFGSGVEEENVRIGISKIVAHPALDAVERGIQDELEELGYGGITYDLQNANGDMNAAASIASKFKADRVNAAVGIATPTSQALVQALTEIAVVFTAVTDPVDSGLVTDLDNEPSSNVTGYSDMTPVREQIEMMVDLGGVDRIGHVYASGEANAVTLANMAEEVCNELGIDFITSTVTNSAEVRQATQAIADKVDAIYVSTDNTVVSALSSVTDVAASKGIPVVTADPSSAEDYDVLAAYGFDYYTMGRATGRLLKRIIEGENPGSIPVQFLTDAEDLVLHLNLDVAEELGLDLSDDAIEQADQIVENGTLRKK